MSSEEQKMRDEAFADEFDDLESSGEGVGNWPLVVALLVAVALVGYVITDGLESQTYFYTVDQAVAQGNDLVGQTVRVKGQVEEGSIVGEDGQLGRAFRIAEKGKTLAVTYDRALPDTFKEGVEVVAQGTVDDSHTLVADEIMVKCPSRYEGAPPTDMPHKDPRAQR